ncbi:MAG: MerR family transcriptional regulator [Firmicutes bacterium]|nr:MerR family transcriptional regulator [Bacillota bacterium]
MSEQSTGKADGQSGSNARVRRTIKPVEKKTETLTIQQMSQILQVEPSTLRFWEKEFAEYLHINTKGKRRRYNQQHLEILTQIKELLQTEQYTIKGAKRRLELDRSLASALGVENNLKTTIFFMFSAIMQELQAAREESRHLARQLELLRNEKTAIEERLAVEQSKSLLEFLRDKFQARKGAEPEFTER